MAILTLAELIGAGALTYATGLFTREYTVSEIWDRLHRNYPDQPGADLDYIVELATQIIAARQIAAVAEPLERLGPAVIPFVPGLPAGKFQIDVQYTIPNAPRGKGFVRLDFDDTDLLIGLLWYFEGIRPPTEPPPEPPPIPKSPKLFPFEPHEIDPIWAEARRLVENVPPGTLVGDLAEMFPMIFPLSGVLPPEWAAQTLPVPVTRGALENVLVGRPMQGDLIYRPKILFLGRG